MCNSGGWAVALCGIACCGGCDRKDLGKISLGGGVRQVRGEYLIKKTKILLPVAELKWQQEIKKDLDVYARLQAVGVSSNLGETLLGSEAKGEFQSLGIGINYYPFATRLIGLDLGTEIYRGSYRLAEDVGPVHLQIDDNFCGGGANVGGIGELKIGQWQDMELLWASGRNFTDTCGNRGGADLDGWYFILGAKIALGSK